MAKALFDATTDAHEHLLAATPVVPDAVISRPLLNLPVCKVIVFAMDADQSISEHRAPSVATMHVLDGRLRFVVNGTERELTANSWLVIPSHAPHDLDALEPTRFLLTLIKEPVA